MTLVCPHGYAGEQNSDCPGDDAVAYRVTDGRITYDVELGDGDLRRDDGGVAAVAVLDDLEESEAGLGVERYKPEVVEDGQGCTGDAADVALVVAYGTRGLPIVSSGCRTAEINRYLFFRFSFS